MTEPAHAASMMAIQAPGGKGPAEALTLVSRPRPEPGQGEILIRVRAAGVNRADLMQRRGSYPPPPGASDIIGMEVAGEVAALGPGAGRWKIGDRVAALMAGGGYAEYAAADARHALPIPVGLDFVQAACLPERCSRFGAMCLRSAPCGPARPCSCTGRPPASA